MPDPFLQAHAVRDRWFDIGGVLSPISIRDQMIRARMIIDRAIDAHIVGAGNSVLIVGGGVAGVSAAIHAARRGLQTTLVYNAMTPFTRQAGCLTRYVDPVQYDWPVSHWKQITYPVSVPPVPLSPEPLGWTANYSSALAVTWSSRLFLARTRYPNLSDFHSRYPTYLTQTPPGKEFVTFNAPVSIGGAYATTFTFDLVVSCIGFGTERCHVPSRGPVGTIDYCSHRFWDTDPYKQPNLGCSTKPNVLISGGGDGALQDFLRIATNCISAKELFNNICSATPAIDWQVIENSVQDADDQGQRAYIWANNKKHDHDALNPLHQSFESEIAQLVGNAADWSDICVAIGTQIRHDWKTLTLLHDCIHFSKSYALNRFLVLLLKEYFLKNKLGRVEFILNSALVEIECVGHIPTGTSSFCHGKDHKAYSSNYSCFSPGAPTMPVTSLPNAPYQVVIVRHGITPARPSWGTTPPYPAVRLSNVRQVLPYYCNS